jgi:FkbM family methyltransferase
MESKRIRKTFRKLLRRIGYDVVSYDPRSHPVARRLKLMEQYRIDLVFDVGANTGQYGSRIRDIGYKGKIVSFEPISEAFRELAVLTDADPLWDAVNMALGDEDGTIAINIAGNSQSSSILEMLPSHVEAAPGSGYVGSEDVKIRRIDSIIDDYCTPDSRLYLKIDAQGYEKNVMSGAAGSLDRISGVQMEVSFVPLYEGETLLPEMMHYMNERGFTLMSLEPGYANSETGQLMQADCLFFRSFDT